MWIMHDEAHSGLPLYILKCCAQNSLERGGIGNSIDKKYPQVILEIRNRIKTTKHQEYPPIPLLNLKEIVEVHLTSMAPPKRGRQRI